MNRNFWIGVLCCAGLFSFMAFMPQVGTEYKNVSEVKDDFSSLFKFANHPNWRVSLTTPTLSEFKNDGEPIWVNRSGQVSLFTRVLNTTYSIVLTNK